MEFVALLTRNKTDEGYLDFEIVRRPLEIAIINRFGIFGGDDEEDYRKIAPPRAPTAAETPPSDDDTSSSNNEFPGSYGATGYEDGDDFDYSIEYEDGVDFGYGNGRKPSRRRLYGGSLHVFRGSLQLKIRKGVFAEGNSRKRIFDRHSQFGNGTGSKRRSAGRGNWGGRDDDIAQVIKEAVTMYGTYSDYYKKLESEDFGDDNRFPVDMPEDELSMMDESTMTLEEYEKVLEENKKALEALRTGNVGRLG